MQSKSLRLKNKISAKTNPRPKHCIKGSKVLNRPLLHVVGQNLFFQLALKNRNSLLIVINGFVVAALVVAGFPDLCSSK